jgi:gamma-glutamylcyclotransferase (GGCT)/AIG2-like uncharacterized protein YtfP
MATIYYFAYGSNMNHKQMKERCKSAKFLCRAYLENYDFVYDGYSSSRKGAVANIIPKEKSIVWGGLWEIDEKDIKQLDRYEGYPYVYVRKEVIVKDDNNKEYRAIVYLRNPQELNNPNDEYRKIVIEGAVACGLPNEYIEEKLKKEL